VHLALFVPGDEVADASGLRSQRDQQVLSPSPASPRWRGLPS